MEYLATGLNSEYHAKGAKFVTLCHPEKEISVQYSSFATVYSQVQNDLNQRLFIKNR